MVAFSRRTCCSYDSREMQASSRVNASRSRSSGRATSFAGYAAAPSESIAMHSRKLGGTAACEPGLSFTTTLSLWKTPCPESIMHVLFPVDGTVTVKYVSVWSCGLSLPLRHPSLTALPRLSLHLATTVHNVPNATHEGSDRSQEVRCRHRR